MNYNVDDVIVFDSDLNTLTHIETKECISLTMSQAMLLELLLRSKSEILSRDDIIDLLWQRHGINSSGNTLTQYVSLLRRLFQHFGLEELIITIPRVGLRLNPSIRVTECTEILKSSDTIRDEDLFSIQDVQNQKVVSDIKPLSIIIIISLFLIIGFIISFIHFSYKKNNINHSFNFFPFNDCQIGLNAHLTSEDKELILREISKVIADNKLVCSKERIIYFDFNKTVSGKDYGRTMLAFCTLGDNKTLLSCDNYYYRNWRVE